MAINEGMLTKAVTGIVLVTVLFSLYAALMPTAQAAGDDLNASGVPLGSIFTSGGVVFVIIMAALVIAVIAGFMKKK